MSNDSWHLLVAALSPLVGVVQIGVQMYLHKPPVLASSPRRAGGKQTSTSPVLPFYISRVQLGVVLASLLVSMVFSAIGFVSTIKSQDALRDELEQDHLEATLKSWLVPFGFKMQEMGDSSAFFSFVGTATPDRPVTFSRVKEFPQFLVV